MDGRQADSWSRREFLSRLTMAGTAGLLGLHSRPVGAEPPPETTTLRLGHGALCEAPALLAEALLEGEGFSEMQYVKKEGGVGLYKAVASGEVDIGIVFSGPLIVRVDAGDPIVMLAGPTLAALASSGLTGFTRSAT